MKDEKVVEIDFAEQASQQRIQHTAGMLRREEIGGLKCNQADPDARRPSGGRSSTPNHDTARALRFPRAPTYRAGSTLRRLLASPSTHLHPSSGSSARSNPPPSLPENPCRDTI